MIPLYVYVYDQCILNSCISRFLMSPKKYGNNSVILTRMKRLTAPKENFLNFLSLIFIIEEVAIVIKLSLYI